MFRRGEVKILEDKDGARLPDKYTVGKLLQNETMIYAYSSGNTDLWHTQLILLLMECCYVTQMRNLQVNCVVPEKSIRIFEWFGGRHELFFSEGKNC